MKFFVVIASFLRGLQLLFASLSQFHGVLINDILTFAVQFRLDFAAASLFGLFSGLFVIGSVFCFLQTLESSVRLFETANAIGV